ncbi:MAG: iron-containing alcohol dehydrogenase [Pseudomonadota bacterium]
MTVLSFATSGRIICAPGSSQGLADQLAAMGARKVLFVSDQGIRDAGLMDPVLLSLVTNGIDPRVFDAVEADPSAETILAATKLAKDFRADAVVGMGGGSPMDVAKLAALLAASDQPLEEAYGVDKATGPRLPLILIPTTAGTGSEVTPIAIVTAGAQSKQGVVSPHLLPDVALLDPELTLGLPPAITAATGIDAMVHAIEAFSSAQKKNPISDALAKEALRLLHGGVERAYRNGTDLAARSDAMLGAAMAGMAFANAPVAAVHALAYPLGARFHVPHGVSNALVLPHVLRFNAPAAAEHYGALAEIICASEVLSKARSPADAFIMEMDSLCARLNVPRRLRDVGISETDIPVLAADAMEQTRLLVNNPRAVTEADAHAIYEAAF